MARELLCYPAPPTTMEYASYPHLLSSKSRLTWALLPTPEGPFAASRSLAPKRSYTGAAGARRLYRGALCDLPRPLPHDWIFARPTPKGGRPVRLGLLPYWDWRILKSKLSSWVGRPPVLGLVARQFWGWPPSIFGLGARHFSSWCSPSLLGMHGNPRFGPSS